MTLTGRYNHILSVPAQNHTSRKNHSSYIHLPRSTVATDIFEWCNQKYLVLVDSYSGWYEIDLLPDVTSDATLISDNGRLITSQCFKDFAAQLDFTHITSSPDFSHSNGCAGRAVCSAKKLLEKSHRNGNDVSLNLLNLRNVLCELRLGLSAQRSMLRQANTLPISKKPLEPHMHMPKR